MLFWYSLRRTVWSLKCEGVNAKLYSTVLTDCNLQPATNHARAPSLKLNIRATQLIRQNILFRGLVVL